MTRVAVSAALLLLLFTLTSAPAEPSSVIVHLRTRKFELSTRDTLHRPLLRRRLLQHSYLTGSARWGVLQHAHHFLLGHQPQLTHQQRHALTEHIEAAGCHLVGYVPDHSLLVVGTPDAAAQAARHEHVVGAVPHAPVDKLAPEWQQILSQIREVLSKNLSDSSSEQQQQLRVQEVLAALQVRSEVDATGRPQVAVQVVFPALLLAQEHAQQEGQPGQQQQQQRLRIQRLLRQSEEYDAGAAAAADWAAPLQRQFGARISRSARHLATVLAPSEQLASVLDWLAQRPAVQWLSPAPRLRLRNRQASAITQSGQPASAASGSNVDPSLHPVWAAGITGANQTIGCGDSGVDRLHCYFYDPSVNWNQYVRLQDGIKTFDCPVHYKIRYYRALGDTTDSNGHGTHVCGTLVARPYDASVATDTTDYIGMAPDAKLAFIDLADSSSDSIFTPADLQNDYFSYLTNVGAVIHSASWGASSVYYDALSAQVDMYAWSQPDFLPVFAAGNDGQGYIAGGTSANGQTTVTSPANSKNCLSVGATQTAGEVMTTGAVQYTVFDATASQGDNYATTFRVMQAAFGQGIGTLGNRAYPLAVASPLDACSALQNGGDLSGKVVLIERGNCYFGVKAANAQAAGAAAALVFDDKLGAYFVVAADSATGQGVSIPTMSITRRLGQNLQNSIAVGRNISLTFSPATKPSSSFQNLSPYSSQGPTPDGRVKPDIVAPGTIVSAKAGSGTSNSCDTRTMAGTSMATPVVAGSAALVRQYYQDGFYPSGQKNDADSLNPSGALLKATLLAGASSLRGFEADTGLPIDPPPSFHQGFGRVMLGQSLYLSGNPYNPTRLQVVDRIQINAGDTHSYCVRANGGPLSVTLVWTDYPATPLASKALVNDLDLTVRAAGLNGIPLLGNGGSVADPSTPDRENNVEQVALDALPSGQVSIEVKGSSIYTPAGSPSYALVVVGDFSGSLAAPGSSADAGQCTITVATIKSGPVGLTNEDPVTFEFSTQSGNTNGVAFECKLGDSSGNLTMPGNQNWTACTSPISYKDLPDGSYQFAVRGQGETISSTQNFIKVTQPPTLSWKNTSPAAATTTNATASFEFQGQAALPDVGVNFTCTLSAAGADPLQGSIFAGKVNSQPITLGQGFSCSSPQDFHWLLPGAWELRVEAADAAGNRALPLDYKWSVAFDASKQYTRLLSGPYGMQRKVNMSFEFKVLRGSDGQEAQGTATQCWLQSGGSQSAAFAACASPFAVADNISDGQYTFYARAAGSSDPTTEATSTFIIDSVPPITSLTEKPDPIRTSSSATLQFSANKEGSTFQCRLTNSNDSSAGSEAYTPCTSPQSYANLTDGSYTFSVYAVDLVGNQGSPVNASFAVDTQPPVFTSLNYPQAVSTPSVTVTFTADDGPTGTGVKNVTCRFRPLVLASSAQNTSGAQFDWALCSSPVTYSNLAEGHYGLTLRASDNAGLLNTTNEHDVYVMLTPPKVNVSSVPSMQAAVPSTVTFTFADATGMAAGVRPNVSTFQTRVRSIDLQTFYALRNASVVAGAGGSNVLFSSVGRRLAAIVGRPVQMENDSTRSSMRTFTPGSIVIPGRRRLLASDGGSSNNIVDASLVGSWVNCSSPCTYSRLASGYYAFSARQVDLAGTVGNASAESPFQVDDSLDSGGGLPTWAIIVIGAAGGTLLLVLVILLLWFCCRRKGATSDTTPSPMQPSAPSSASYVSTAGAWAGYPPAYTPNPVVHRPPPLQPSGYVAPAAAYGQPLVPSAYPGRGAGYPVLADGTYPPAVADPLEAQQMAYALAASKKQTSREDVEVERAIQASLQEQQRPRPAAATWDASDAELRAAIEASLREQQQQAEMQPWTFAGSSGGGNIAAPWQPTQNYNSSH